MQHQLPMTVTAMEANYKTVGASHEIGGLEGPLENYIDSLLSFLDPSLSLSTCSFTGDLDSNGTVNIQDIIIAVQVVISDQYDECGDINQDNTLNIADIIKLVNLIAG